MRVIGNDRKRYDVVLPSFTCFYVSNSIQFFDARELRPFAYTFNIITVASEPLSEETTATERRAAVRSK